MAADFELRSSELQLDLQHAQRSCHTAKAQLSQLNKGADLLNTLVLAAVVDRISSAF